jgi:hypothetical protein
VSASFQTFAAITVVAGTIAAFLWRALAKRRRPGCGGACGCPVDEFKARLKP